jgi:glutamine amidotransferase
MCRLLGLVANKPVDIKFSLQRFKKFSTNNPDGWGIGWYENNSPMVFKQGISANDKGSQLPELSKEVRSKIIITHVRKKTVAPASVINSHPFQYKNWLFAHNGFVDGKYLLSLLKNEHIKERPIRKFIFTGFSNVLIKSETLLKELKKP